MKWFGQKSQRLFTKTRQVMSRALGVLQGKKALSEADLAQLRQILIDADCGLLVAEEAITHLRDKCSQGLKEGEQLIDSLKQYLVKQLPQVDISLSGDLNVILIVGVNGVGKTTSIAKLAHYYIAKGHKVAVASGDTYRAAADEQLKHWADKVGAIFITRPNTQDPAAVMFDAYHAAKEQGATILLADTAGRMHSNQGLMDQLAKVKRVLGKCDEDAPHKTWVVLDGSLGQVNLEQVKIFKASVPLDGAIVTKVDGSAKGGSMFAVGREGLPICFIGSGEGEGDWSEFNPEAFVEEVVGS